MCKYGLVFNKFHLKVVFKKIVHIFRRLGINISPITPDHTLKLLWDLFVFTILIINIIYIPLKISFEI